MAKTQNTVGAAALNGAAQSLSDFVAGPVTGAAGTIDTVVARAFSSVEKSIARAAVSGKLSMKGMADAIVSDLDRIGSKTYISQPIESAISSILGAIEPVSGARAAGGPVAAGESYLVGEQGPEVFVPASSGSIAAGGGAVSRPQVSLNVQATDAKSFLRSETQLSAMMLRVLKRGQRNM
jgi:phage-related minor tail protein